jgi:putative transferase (TIGR04331 family)
MITSIYKKDIKFNNEPRYLITTADEQTWKFDQPVVFLGEWCLLYDRKHIWGNMDSVVSHPYGLEIEQKDADYLEARKIENKLFPIFCKLLNEQHNVQYSNRFWRIVLGNWFRRIIEVLLNRINTLQQVLEKYKISGTTTYSNDNYILTSKDSYSGIWSLNDDRWNNLLNIRILSMLEGVDFPIEILSKEITNSDMNFFQFKPLFSQKSLRRRCLERCYQTYSVLARKMVRNEDAFILNSYLPVNEVIKLELAMGQWPQLWQSPTPKLVKKPDRLLRERLTRQLEHKSACNLENISRALIFELLPICFLEDFTELSDFVNQLPWPKSPNFIFTSNSFDTDEAFKLWAALKVQDGSKYFVGQHGGLYGTHRHMHHNTIEELVSDKFLTWGWTDGLKQHIPAFVFKNIRNKKNYYNHKGGLLLIQLHLNHRVTTWDDTFEFKKYFEDQKKFINNISDFPNKNITVRLHSLHKYLNWSEQSRWYDFNPALKIDKGELSIKLLISESRLVIHSYDSTGILETLSQNIPTLAFWQNNFAHIRESAKPYYKMLADVGIIHFSPESVANKVNEVWEDVDGWWSNKLVQKARKEFCDRYARLSASSAKELKEILYK